MKMVDTQKIKDMEVIFINKLKKEFSDYPEAIKRFEEDISDCYSITKEEKKITRIIHIPEDLDKKVLSLCKKNEYDYSQFVIHALKIISADNPFEYGASLGKKTKE